MPRLKKLAIGQEWYSTKSIFRRIVAITASSVKYVEVKKFKKKDVRDVKTILLTSFRDWIKTKKAVLV